MGKVICVYCNMTRIIARSFDEVAFLNTSEKGIAHTVALKSGTWDNSCLPSSLVTGSFIPTFTFSQDICEGGSVFTRMTTIYDRIIHGIKSLFPFHQINVQLCKCLPYVYIQ